MLDSADPLNGWPLGDVIKKATTASHDIYGSLYRYLNDTISLFCEEAHKIDVNFTLFQVDAVELPSRLGNSGKPKGDFDRIEVCPLSASY